MTPAKIHPNANETRILHMRINPDSKLFKLHPMDLDIEHYLAKHGGRAVVRMQFLLARDKNNTDGKSVREYHPVLD